MYVPRSRKVMVTSIASNISYDKLCHEMRDICNFDDQQLFTMKWVDEEGEHVLSFYAIVS